MTRTNRPDTLLTELRDIKRRLRLLEAARMRPPAAALAATSGPVPAPAPPDRTGSGPAAGTVPVPLAPVRPTDWPATGDTEWVRIYAVRVAPDPAGYRLELPAVADPGTSGELRVLLDGVPVGEPLPVTGEPSRHAVPVAVDAGSPPAAAREIAVEARRTGAGGRIRLLALLHAAGHGRVPADNRPGQGPDR